MLYFGFVKINRWGNNSDDVFTAMEAAFMKPVIEDVIILFKKIYKPFKLV